MSDKLSKTLDSLYEATEGSPVLHDYCDRHGINSASVLTIYNDEMASLVAGYLVPRVTGKVVIEIGGGIGLLACHLGLAAKRVFCIEANPMWSWTFTKFLLERKPPNVSFLFGAAREFEDSIRGDIAIFCTHSDVAGMGQIGARFAPKVIDVYGELIHANPGAFDKTATILRGLS